MFRRPWVLIHRAAFAVPLLAARVPARGQSRPRAGSAGAAGWSATDCQTCHDKAVGPAFQKTKHAELDQSCAQVPRRTWPSTSGRRWAATRTAPTPSLKKLTAQQINDDLPEVPREGRPGELPGQHARAPQRGLHVVPQHPRRQVGPKAQLKTQDGLRDLLHVPQVRARQGDADLAPPGARGQDGLLELPQPARRPPPEDDQGRLGQRALLQVPRREARAVPVRARAGPRGLRDVPRAARDEPQAAADAEAAEPLLELPPHRVRPLRLGRQPLRPSRARASPRPAPRAATRRRTRASSRRAARTAT